MTTDNPFEELSRSLRKLNEAGLKLVDQLDTLNSAFPATKVFLLSRGVERVSQLDAEGREALKQHLEKTLKETLEQAHEKPPQK